VRAPSRIAIRLLLFNILLVFLPAAGFFYLDVYEKQLLTVQERAMVQQGRLLAAALSGSGDLDAAHAEGLLRRLEQRTESRLRIFGRSGELLADSARLGPRQAEAESSSRYPSSRKTRDNLLYRVGAFLYRLGERLSPGPMPESDSDRSPTPALPNPEVRAALAGRYGAGLRPTPGGQQPSLTLYSAIPVRGGGQVVGAVLVSQSTVRILRALQEVRLDIFKVFLGSVAVAVVLSLLVSTTIARPLRQLRDEANDLLDRRGRLRGRFRGSQKPDEIGDLARALERLTARLEENQQALEAFAADVSHELKNPLASIRSATELLAEVDDPEDRHRFLTLAQREVSRLERLLTALREITEIDARREPEAQAPVDLAVLLPEVVESLSRRADNRVRINLQALPGPPALVRATPERLVQVFENILDNALGFSPEAGQIALTLATEDGAVKVRIEDQGPGIPETHLDRIFDRFFSYRPGEPHSRNGHTGLGLAIVKAIVEGYGGTIQAANRPGGGATFEVRLPATPN
jgi:two-component system sensor histidine kinase ChvG